ncbi:MAG TPA: hypothetical protein DEB31_02570 [Clostridiales bacterium]|nr:hypothetical protein [Clostridiales bacterium]
MMKNKTVADVFSDFRSQGLAARHQYELACERNAHLQRIREEIKDTGLLKLSCALRGEPEKQHDQKLLELEKEERQVLQNEIEAAEYKCGVCRDSGMLPTGYCTCLLRKIYTECYGAADIAALPGKYDVFDLARFDSANKLPSGKTQAELAAFSKKRIDGYMDDFPDNKRKTVLIFGKAGLGKTHLLYYMAKKAYALAVDTLLIRANELFSLFHAHRLGEEVDLSYLYGAKLLLVDDIGTEPITQNVSNEYFYELIEQRLKLGLHSVFVTNADNLLQRYDERISSRLDSRQDCLRLFFDGRDLRVN